MKKNNLEHENTRLIIITVFLLFVMLLTFGLSWCSLNKRAENLEKRYEERIDQILQPSATTQEQSEYQKAIDFLESEITEYRALVKEEWDRFLEIIRIVGALSIAILTYIGWENRKKISDIIQENYARMVKEEMARFIGGKDREEYLRVCIEKEKLSRNKKILFLVQKNRNKDIDELYGYYSDNGYQVEQEEVEASMEKDKLRALIKNHDLVIYQVDASEGNNKKDGSKKENYTYVKLAELSKEKEVDTILYCADGITIDRGKTGKNPYISAANFKIPLFQNINSILEMTRNSREPDRR